MSTPSLSLRSPEDNSNEAITPLYDQVSSQNVIRACISGAKEEVSYETSEHLPVYMVSRTAT